MRRPIALWKQALGAALLVAVAIYGWMERERLSRVVAAAAKEWSAAEEPRGGATGEGARGAARGGEQAGGRRAAARGRGGRRGRGSRRGRGGGRQPAPVILAALETLADDLELDLVGTARASRSVSLRVKTTGEIVETRLAAGRRVAEGEVLVRLDDEDARLAVERAAARKETTARALARLEALEQSGAVTDAALETAAAAATEARIDLRRAEKTLADHTLRAPFAGVLGLPDVEAGDWINSGDAVGSLDDRAALWIEADIPEALIGRLSVGQSVVARSVAARRETFEGEIVALDSRVDPASRTARARIALPNDDDRLRPGVSFTVTLVFPGQDYPAAPELALQYGREGLYVWRVREGAAQQVPVRLVRRRAGLVLLEGVEDDNPLSAGDDIVVEGAMRMREGRKVRAVGAPDEEEQGRDASQERGAAR